MIITEKAKNTLKTVNSGLSKLHDLKNRINALPSKDFSKAALAFNQTVETIIENINSLPFETTEKSKEADINEITFSV